MSLPLLDEYDIDVSSIVEWWASNNIGRIVRACAQKGGWEGWAQVELASVLQDYCLETMAGGDPPINITVEREVPVYTGQTRADSRKRADIVLEASKGTRKDHIIIELKCESYYNTANFASGVADDVVKIGGDINSACQPAMRWVFGFSVSEAGYEAMKNTPGVGSDGLILYPSPNNQTVLTPAQQATRPKIALWWPEEERVGAGQMYDDFRANTTFEEAVRLGVAGGLFSDRVHELTDDSGMEEA